MAVETERRFLLASNSWRDHVVSCRFLAQGYLNTAPEVAVRIRRDGENSFLTIKGSSTGASRPEFEYAIPNTDADQILKLLCKGRTVKKTRHNVPLNGHTWEIDVFEGENSGLVIAEVELQSELEHLTIPAWIGLEITGKHEYSNAALAQKPYSSWTKEHPGAAR